MSITYTADQVLKEWKDDVMRDAPVGESRLTIDGNLAEGLTGFSLGGDPDHLHTIVLNKTRRIHGPGARTGFSSSIAVESVSFYLDIGGDKSQYREVVDNLDMLALIADGWEVIE